MSSTANINYLSKEELTFEYSLKLGKPPVAYSMERLRKDLRASSKNNLKSDPKHLVGLIDFRKEQVNLESKLALLTQDLDEAKEAEIQMLNIAKFKAKIMHYSNRIKVLRQFKLEDKERSILDKYADKISKIDERFNTLLSQIDEQEFNTFEHNLDASIEEEDDLASSLVDTAQRMEQRTKPCSDINVVTAITNPTENPNEDIKSPTTSVTVNNNCCDAAKVGPNSSEKSNSETVPNLSLTKLNPDLSKVSYNASLLSYDKLPNPLNKYLHNFKITNGLNVPDLLHFLKSMLSLKSEAHLTDPDILSILHSYAEGPLLLKLINCQQQATPSLDLFHETVIDSFLPYTLKEKLKQDFVFRPQLLGESLYSYMKDIRLHHDMLRCDMSESSLVQLIRSSLCPEVRNKLIFQPSPNTFKELEQLCISLVNIEYQDLVRSQTSYTYQARPSLDVSKPPNNNQGRPFVDVKVCYNCQKRGHIARNCFKLKSNNQSKN